VKPFYDVFFIFVVVPITAMWLIIVSMIHGTEEAERRLDQLLDDGLTDDAGKSAGSDAETEGFE
jgi:hypothetical protein